MKKIDLILHRDIDKATGRNEKLISRIGSLRDDGWSIDTYLIEENEDINDAARIILVLLESIIVTLRIGSKNRRNRTSIIWTMNAPSYLHIPGLLCKLFLKKVLWVAELRDALCEEPFYSRKPRATKVLNKLIEVPTVLMADKILTIKGFNSYKGYYKKKYPELAEKFHALPYPGYPSHVYDEIEAKNFDKFTITYAGTFYDYWIEPISFLKGFSKFVKSNGISPDEIQILFFCRGWKNEYSELIGYLGLSRFIKRTGFVSKEEIISVMKGSDLLLYINGSDKTRKDMVHSKFYDYVASGSLLLLLSKEGFEISRLVKKYGLGVTADEFKSADISKVLARVYYNKEKYQKSRTSTSKIFTRKTHDQAFVDILDLMIR